MKLQIALDVSEKKALTICQQIKNYVDIIEIGTPLVKQEGLDDVVKKFKKFKKPIVADLKTLDTGFLEAEMAFKAGAKITSVAASANISTIKGTVKAARKYKCEVMVDMINFKGKNLLKRVREIAKLGVHYINIHTGIDLQEKGENPLKNLEKVSKIINNKKIVVAGGISLKNIDKIIGFKPEIIIIGGAITKARNPREIAMKIKEKMKLK